MLHRVVDLFAGCGGLSLGLEQAGFEIALANEIDHSACETYAANHAKTPLVQGDIRSIDRSVWRSLRGSIDLVAGGPPCQGFSVTGRRQYGEVPSQNTLVEAMLDVIEQVAPRLVLIENVAGFRTAQLRPGTRALPFVLQRLDDLGYAARAHVIQAAALGLPSLRSRLIVIASRDGLPDDPFATPELSEKRVGPTCLDAISDLPPLNAGQGVEDFVPYGSAPKNDYQRRMRHGAVGVANHVSMRHTPRLVERFATIKPGSSSFLLPDKGVTVYKSNNQRLLAHSPALCITANFQSNYVHPLQHRNLTAREAARLMTFPDHFVFKGKRTLMSKKFLEKYDRAHEIGLSQYNQIGNAVPPELGRLLGASLLRMIRANERARAA